MAFKIVSARPEQDAAFGYPSRLVGRQQVAEGTMAFQLERPRNFLFKPGQFIDLSLPGVRPDGSDGLTHTFSIASSPADEQITVATRMRDTAFKRALSRLAIGAQVRVKGPMGSFTLHNNVSRQAVFLAGGIGITPFLSMISNASANLTHPSITLFYVNRQLRYAAFMDTLREFETFSRNFKFVPTLTRLTEGYREWRGETGYINSAMLRKHISNLSG